MMTQNWEIAYYSSTKSSDYTKSLRMWSSETQRSSLWGPSIVRVLSEKQKQPQQQKANIEKNKSL